MGKFSTGNEKDFLTKRRKRAREEKIFLIERKEKKRGKMVEKTDLFRFALDLNRVPSVVIKTYSPRFDRALSNK